MSKESSTKAAVRQQEESLILDQFKQLQQQLIEENRQLRELLAARDSAPGRVAPPS